MVSATATASDAASTPSRKEPWLVCVVGGVRLVRCESSDFCYQPEGDDDDQESDVDSRDVLGRSSDLVRQYNEARQLTDSILSAGLGDEIFVAANRVLDAAEFIYWRAVGAALRRQYELRILRERARPVLAAAGFSLDEIELTLMRADDADGQDYG